MKLLIIGISGTTCSGKTTVAKKIHENLKNSVLINQDTYFLPVDDPRHTLVTELNHFNWDILSSLDMAKMYADVMDVVTSTSKLNDTQENGSSNEFKFLILEGFLLFNCKPIADLCHQKYFVDLTREVCWDRRSKRVYDPPDVPGYFDKVVWPEYLKQKSEILADNNLSKSVKFLDGSKNIDEVYNEIMSGIGALLY